MIRRRARISILLLSVAGAAGCKQSTTTPSGTEILQWDASKATRASVASAKELGPRSSKDMKIKVQPEMRAPFTIKLHLETGPIEVIEEGKAARRTSPLLIRASVDENADWALAGKCYDGPHYRMPSVGPDGAFITPEPMVLLCSIPMFYKDTFKDLSTSLSLEIAGDGAVVPQTMFGTASVE